MKTFKKIVGALMVCAFPFFIVTAVDSTNHIIFAYSYFAALVTACGGTLLFIGLL